MFQSFRHPEGLLLSRYIREGRTSQYPEARQFYRNIFVGFGDYFRAYALKGVKDKDARRWRFLLTGTIGSRWGFALRMTGAKGRAVVLVEIGNCLVGLFDSGARKHQELLSFVAAHGGKIIRESARFLEWKTDFEAALQTLDWDYFGVFSDGSGRIYGNSLGSALQVAENYVFYQVRPRPGELVSRALEVGRRTIKKKGCPWQ